MYLSMYLRRASGLLAVAWSATGCVRHSRPSATDGAVPERHASGCAAVAAAVDSLVPRGTSTRLALAESSAVLPARAYAELPSTIPGLDATTWATFEARSRARGPACSALPGGRPVVLVRDSVLRMLPRTDPEAYWTAFRRRFPEATGLTSVSAVGESADGRQALLVVNHACGGLCGWGYVVLLGRASGDAWSVRYARMLWVS